MTLITITYESEAPYTESDVKSILDEVKNSIVEMDGDAVFGSFKMTAHTETEAANARIEEAVTFLSKCDIRARIEIRPVGSGEAITMDLVEDIDDEDED